MLRLKKMLVSSFCTCCGCTVMGSMCAKHVPDDANGEIPKRPKRKHISDEEIQPLVDELPSQNKLDEAKFHELIPPAQDHNKDQSPSASSSDPSEDMLPEQEPLISDDNIEQPEYSKNDVVTPVPLLSVPNHECKDEQHSDKAQSDDEESKTNLYALPSSLADTPYECSVQMNEEDKAFAKQIQDKYAVQLTKHPVDNMHFMERYTVGYRHVKKKKRLAAICKDIDFFFEMHEEYDMDNIIHTTSTQEQLNTWKQFIYGEDPEGHPIMYDLIGSSICKDMKRVFIKDDEPFGQTAFQHMFRFLRKMENYKVQNTNKYGKKIYRHIQILDMDGFTTEHMKGKNRKVVNLVVDGLTRMFPEGVDKMFIINTPWPFRAIWAVVKGFMDPITVAKTKVLDDKYLKEMIKHIPIEMIPPRYGGKGAWEIQYGSIPKNYDVDVYHGLD
eukprot:146696_1